MKKNKIFLFISFLIFSSFALMIFNGIIVLDNSAERTGDILKWNDITYVSASGDGYTEGKTIAKTIDGAAVKAIEEDETNTFIVVRSFLDQYLLVREDYDILTYGEATTVCWDSVEIEDEIFYDTLFIILEQAITDFEYKTDNIEGYSADGSQMRRLYFGYGDCPIATEFVGYMGKIYDKWYITTEIPNYQRNTDGSPKQYTVQCYAIPTEFISLIEDFYN